MLNISPALGVMLTVSARSPRWCPPKVRSHCRFRNRGTKYVSESGMKRMSGGTKRQCDRALCPTSAASSSACSAAIVSDSLRARMRLVAVSGTVILIETNYNNGRKVGVHP